MHWWNMRPIKRPKQRWKGWMVRIWWVSPSALTGDSSEGPPRTSAGQCSAFIITFYYIALLWHVCLFSFWAELGDADVAGVQTGGGGKVWLHQRSRLTLMSTVLNSLVVFQSWCFFFFFTVFGITLLHCTTIQMWENRFFSIKKIKTRIVWP